MALRASTYRCTWINSDSTEYAFLHRNVILTYPFCRNVMVMLFPPLSGESHISTISRLSSDQREI